jgi:hypothetical protein
VTAKQSTGNASEGAKSGIRHLFQDLNHEESLLRKNLLDAALAGLRLARTPQSQDVRRDVAKVWAAMEPILSHHLDVEDGKLLPWLREHSHLSLELLRQVRDCHHKLRNLIGTLAKSDLSSMSAEEAREVGRALTTLAVVLDDAIEDEERRLLPRLRKALFEG